MISDTPRVASSAGRHVGYHRCGPRRALPTVADVTAVAPDHSPPLMPDRRPGRAVTCHAADVQEERAA